MLAEKINRAVRQNGRGGILAAKALLIGSVIFGGGVFKFNILNRPLLLPPGTLPKHPFQFNRCTKSLCHRLPLLIGTDSGDFITNFNRLCYSLCKGLTCISVNVRGLRKHSSRSDFASVPGFLFGHGAASHGARRKTHRFFPVPLGAGLLIFSSSERPAPRRR